MPESLINKVFQSALESELKAELNHLSIGWATYGIAKAAGEEMDRIAFKIIAGWYPPGYWERELARRIEERSLRARATRLLRRLRPPRIRRRNARRRLSAIGEALRGHHDYCGCGCCE